MLRKFFKHIWQPPVSKWRLLAKIWKGWLPLQWIPCWKRNPELSQYRRKWTGVGRLWKMFPQPPQVRNISSTIDLDFLLLFPDHFSLCNIVEMLDINHWAKIGKFPTFGHYNSKSTLSNYFLPLVTKWIIFSNCGVLSQSN